MHQVLSKIWQTYNYCLRNFTPRHININALRYVKRILQHRTHRQSLNAKKADMYLPW